MRSLAALTLIGTSLVATACARNNGTSDDPDSPSSAVDSEESTEAEGNMIMANVDGADMGGVTADVSGSGAAALTVAGVEAAITANVQARWGACASASSSGANMAIKYTDCTGPHGLVHVTGELDLAITITAANQIQVVATASGLQVNKANLDVNATATYSVTPTEHVLAVSTMGDGTGFLRGTNIDHQGNYTLSWDPTSQCGSIDGTWSTDFSNGSASASRSNDVSLSDCAGGCPTGTLTHHFLLGETLTVTFDGTSVATWATSTGKSGTVNLACQ